MEESTKRVLSNVGVWVGVGVIAVWLGMLVWLISQRGENEIIWSRLVFLLGSIEAVAFAAAGALFGTQVQRERVKDAKMSEAKAKEEAEASKDGELKGVTLAATVRAEADMADAKRSILSSDEGRGASRSLALADEILASKR